MTYWINRSKKAYYIWNQVCFWSIFQLLSAVSVYININNSELIDIKISDNYESSLYKLGGVIFVISVFIIFVAGLTLMYNTVLHQLTMATFYKRICELEYKQLTFIYLLIMGYLIIFLNSTPIFTIPCSAYVLVIHILYTGTILVRKPYQMSLTMHSIGLILNQIVYLIFLAFVNLINFADEFEEIYVLGLGYIILALCVVLLVLTIFRIYY